MNSAPASVGFRFGPPRSARELVIRPRLLDVLQQRFCQRLTLVVAGPGFGKTSLLAQAQAENLLAQQGLDVWLTCHGGDSAISTLARGLVSALQRSSSPVWEPDLDDAVARIAAEVRRRAPEQVALVLDDAHLIEPATPGAALLAALLEFLPSNGHLLLAGREPLPVGSDRPPGEGHLVELGEADLAFTDEEREPSSRRCARGRSACCATAGAGRRSPS
jgi:ATP/maltotriose-dependent transcriptional regulator MalT